MANIHWDDVWESIAGLFAVGFSGCGCIAQFGLMALGCVVAWAIVSRIFGC
jgi:hypothetical protein